MCKLPPSSSHLPTSPSSSLLRLSFPSSTKHRPLHPHTFFYTSFSFDCHEIESLESSLMAPFEVYPIKDASPSAMRRRKGLTSPRRPHIKPAQFARPDAHYALPNQLQRSDFLSQSPTRVASRIPKLPPPTDFEYVGSIEGSGWKPGHVPLFLEWYPENLDRRSVCKFFESGRKYTVGRSPACDFYFPNCEYDSGISGNHLTIKVSSPPILQSWRLMRVRRR